MHVICQIALVRAMLVSACEASGFVVTDCYETERELDSLADDDTVLIQVFDGAHGVVESVAYIRSLAPKAAIALIAPDSVVPILQRSIGSYVSAIIPENVSIDVLTSWLKVVTSGFRLVQNSRLEAPIEGGSQPQNAILHAASGRGAREVLSKRELAVLKRLSGGLPNKTIAKELGISEGTVKVHLRTIFRKVGVHNRTQAALWGSNNP